MCSGHDLYAEEERADSERVGFILKPLRIAELREALERLLRPVGD